MKEPGKDWRSEPYFDNASSPRTGGGILPDMNQLSYERLERLEDSTTSDGRESFVINGMLDENALTTLSQVAMNQFAGLGARITAMTMTVHIEKDSLQVRQIEIDAEYDVEGSSVRSQVLISIDQVNQPQTLPVDLPSNCPGPSA